MGEAAAGPYEYQLYRGSVDESGPENWYLRSIVYDPSVPPEFDVPGEPPGFIPDYRPEVSLYTALPSTILEYSRAILGTFHQRVGAEEQVQSMRAKSNTGAYMNGAWIRFINRGGNIQNKGIFWDGPQFNYRIYAVQVGIDVYHREYDNGHRDFAGFYVTDGSNKSVVKHYTGIKAGKVSFESDGLGLYWTHIGQNGWYLDGVLQWNRYEPNVYSKFQHLNQFTGQNYAASLEGSYPFRLWKNFSIEPQGQIIYQEVASANAFDSAAFIRFNANDSLVSRFGARLVWDKEPLNSTDKKVTTNKTAIWLTPSFSYEAKGVSKTNFSSSTGWIPFVSKLRGSWFSLDLGGTVQLNEILSVYGTIAGETYLNKGCQQCRNRGQAYEAIAGVRFNL